MNDLRFHNPEALHWLWLAVGVGLLIGLGMRARRSALHRFAAASLWNYLLPGVSVARQFARGVLVTLAAVAMAASLLDPRWGVRYEQVHRRGIDILFVVDVSRSMLAEDVRPNRLERAKQYIHDVVEELGGDRVGLISFAGVPSLRCPLTIDYGAFRLSLVELAPQSAARGGSLLGDALRLAGECFTDEAMDAKIIIVLSDGEDQDSYPVEAAQKLQQDLGVRVFTVGLGDAVDGSRIPLRSSSSSSRTAHTGPDGRGTAYLTHQGQEVWSKMNASLLRNVALSGGGAYVPAGTGDADLGMVYREHIAPMSSREFETSRIEIHEPRYQWFAGLALALLLIESWMSDRRQMKSRWPESQEDLA